MHNKTRETVSSARYLGVDLSTNLSFNTHKNRITSNANKSLGFIKRNIKTKHKDVREAAYQTIVRPQLGYGSTVWSPYSQTFIQEIEMFQRRAIRWTMNNYSSHSSVSQMQQQLGWQSLDQRRADARLCMLYKITHGLIAIEIPPYFEQPKAATRQSLRHLLVYRQIHMSTN